MEGNILDAMRYVGAGLAMIGAAGAGVGHWFAARNDRHVAHPCLSTCCCGPTGPNATRSANCLQRLRALDKLSPTTMPGCSAAPRCPSGRSLPVWLRDDGAESQRRWGRRC